MEEWGTNWSSKGRKEGDEMKCQSLVSLASVPVFSWRKACWEKQNVLKGVGCSCTARPHRWRRGISWLVVLMPKCSRMSFKSLFHTTYLDDLTMTSPGFHFRTQQKAHPQLQKRGLFLLWRIIGVSIRVDKLWKYFCKIYYMKGLL